MIYTTKNQKWFTLLIILGVIGFLLVLLTGIFQIVLFELNDTKNMDYYIKAQSASEAWQEIAMLKLKEEWFGFDVKKWYSQEGEEIYDKTGESIILSRDPSNTQGIEFHENKDVFFRYNIDSKTTSYNGMIEPSGFHVIPLFYTDEQWGGRTETPYLTVTAGIADDFVWNILWDETWVSGIGSFDRNTDVKEKVLTSVNNQQNFRLRDTSVQSFLVNNPEKNYLMILNTGTENIEYVMATDNGESFTKPITTVYSSAKIWEIKQNIKLEIDNSKYFDVLKYSLYNSQ